ncbi:MAG: chorismate synthase [Bacteroidota bacterium]
MSNNTFGSILKLTTFGESHGVAMGGVIDGLPSGLPIDLEAIQHLVDLRRPGQSAITSPRNERDRVEILSGLMDGVTLGTPIGFIIRNQDQRSEDYDQLKDIYRPGHADHTWEVKYGIRDHRGSGRASARETVCRVVGGAFAMQLLKHYGVHVHAWTSSVGPVTLPDNLNPDLNIIYQNDVRTCHLPTAEAMREHIDTIRKAGDSCGGTISCVVQNLPAGIGEPVFGKLPALLASAMMSINAAKGFEMGDGFDGTLKKGSEHNDVIQKINGKSITSTNHAGGTHGGISNGNDILFRVGFKPVSTIAIEQNTINRAGEKTSFVATGRHDPCVVPRAVPIVSSMAALVVADLMLKHRTTRL